MFTTVRYFIKTSAIFLVLGTLTGLYLAFTKYIGQTGANPDIITAHVHLILIGSVMMMIMGVAVWFFPRPEKTDKRYNPDLIRAIYWIMSIATLFRFILELIRGFFFFEWTDVPIAVFSALQVLAMILFFYSVWGRIRPLGSQIREAKGEKF